MYVPAVNINSRILVTVNRSKINLNNEIHIIHKYIINNIKYIQEYNMIYNVYNCKNV